jgi:hypothetical protein
MTDAEGKFWSWFKEHSKSYLSIDEIDEDAKEQLLDDLLGHLHEYCDQLYFQVGGMPGEEQELIITAEGNTDFFEQVEILVNNAPDINNWAFTAFIQPQDDLNTTNFEDVELKPADMWFMPLDSASKPKSIGIKVCTPNYDLVSESKWFKSAVFKVLDTVLGEKTFALDIDHIEFGKTPDKPEDHGMIELAELPAFVKWKKAKRSIS